MVEQVNRACAVLPATALWNITTSQAVRTASKGEASSFFYVTIFAMRMAHLGSLPLGIFCPGKNSCYSLETLIRVDLQQMYAKWHVGSHDAEYFLLLINLP